MNSVDEVTREWLNEPPRKPPIGVEPWFLVIEKRIDALLDAIASYRAGGFPYPASWLDELAWLRQKQAELVRERCG